MRYFLLSLFVLLFIGRAFSQDEARIIDFGDLRRNTQRYADVTVRNHAEQSVHIVKIEHSPQIVYRVDKDFIRPDSAFTARIQVNPDTTGAFDYVMRIYLSDNEIPIEMHVTGDVKSMPDYTDLLEQKCPDFSTKPEAVNTEFTVTAVDAETKEVITKSTVTIIRNGSIAESWVMGSEGSLRKRTVPGFLYFVVSHDGYKTAETGVFITPEIETVYIPLRRNVTYYRYRPEEIPDTVKAEMPVEIAVGQREKVLRDQIRTDSATVAEAPEIIGDFDTSLFRPVNIVFVLDVSSSMRLGEKTSLLKYSLNELTDQLRPQDRVCFVTYSEGAEVYLKPTYCTNKQIIFEKISELDPDGMSSSTRGIKLGYKEVQKDMDPAQTNMVIVITDGAFNKYSDDYQQIVERYASKNITFSVVGVRCHGADDRKMREAAEFGNGRYVAINKLSDAQSNLLNEIKIASYKGN